MPTDPARTAELAALKIAIRQFEAVVVAFSGGVDSSLVLAVAASELGRDAVIAATAVSASLPGGALDAAARFTARVGVEHVLVNTTELDRPEYARNDRLRCSHCKSALVDALEVLAAAGGADRQLLTGANADDATDPFRPGVATASARGVRHPLAEAGLTKIDVRALSRLLGLNTWDQPAAPCLASRIAYGVPVTRAGLRRVDAAEIAVRELLIEHDLRTQDLRVRDLGAAVARVEVDADLVPRAQALLPQIEARLRGVGFVEATLAPDGFRSGSLNDGSVTSMSLESSRRESPVTG